MKTGANSTMDGTTIDWNAAWRRARDERPRRKDASFWDKRAPSFCQHTLESDYEHCFIDLMQPQAPWSVLDVGCGSGTLAIPLAERVASITALDFSQGMLTLLEERKTKAGISNITTVHGSWEDDWESLGIAVCDVAISSRSIVVEDLGAALRKLNRFARKRVFLTAMVGDGPNDRRIYEAVGRPLKRGPDYIYVYNILYQMGVYASVSFIPSSDWKQYDGLDEAVEGTRWMLDNLTRYEENRLKEYLSANLVPHEGKWRLPAPRVVRWAFISWDTER